MDVLDYTLHRIGDLKMQSLRNCPQSRGVNEVSKNVEQELVNHLDMQLEIIQSLVENVNKINNNYNNNVASDNSKQARLRNMSLRKISDES